MEVDYFFKRGVRTKKNQVKQAPSKVCGAKVNNEKVNTHIYICIYVWCVWIRSFESSLKD